jgi:hypothetical protein
VPLLKSKIFVHNCTEKKFVRKQLILKKDNNDLYIVFVEFDANVNKL